MTEDDSTERNLRRIDHIADQLADATVEVAAVAALAFIASASVSQAELQILAGAISSVAVGKRYLQSKQ